MAVHYYLFFKNLFRVNKRVHFYANSDNFYDLMVCISCIWIWYFVTGWQRISITPSEWLIADVQEFVRNEFRTWML